MKNNALVLFAKAPVPGQVKTRLSSEFSFENAAILYQAFVEDLIDSFCNMPSVHFYLSCSPSTNHPFFKSLARDYPISLMEQSGRDLGLRMEETMTELSKKGHDVRIIIGADSPTLPPVYVREAFDKLGHNDLVLGPSHDGGYYLIGVSGSTPPIFNPIPWGTDQVMMETLRMVHQEACRLHLLPFWYDIDTPRDVHFLKQHLIHLNRIGQTIPKRTFECLNERLP